MSLFPDIIKEECLFISEPFLFRVANRYILPKLVRDIVSQADNSKMHDCERSVETAVQNLMLKSNYKLRMYGTAKELAENLKIFRNFANNEIFFLRCGFEPWNTKPIIYRSTTGKNYICKQDIFILLQNMILKKHDIAVAELEGSTLFAFLKAAQEKVNMSNEFVQLDEVAFKKFETDFYKYYEERCQENPDYKFKLENSSLEGVVEQWGSLAPKDYIKGIIELYYKRIPVNANPLFWLKSFNFLKGMIESLRKAMMQRPKWFLPFHQNAPEKTRQLRLFEDKCHKFFMVYEVFNVGGINMIKKFNSRQLITNYEGEGKQLQGFFTIDFEDFKAKIGKEIDRIELIRTPILRAKHAAVPIIRNDGEHCILAIDTLFEILREMIFSFKVFQRTEKSSSLSKTMDEAFNQIIDHYFHVTDTHFFDLQTVQKIKSHVEAHFDQFLKKPTKDVRNAKIDGFTLQNLKNELVNLGLTIEFPNIIEFAEVAYDEVVREKKEAVLRTCDLFDAVEHCQLICIFRRYKKLAKYIHDHKSCYRVVDLCDRCYKFKNSKWNQFELSEVELKHNGFEKRYLTSYLDQHLSLPNGRFIVSNCYVYHMDTIEMEKKMNGGVLTNEEHTRHLKTYERGKVVLLDNSDMVNLPMENRNDLFSLEGCMNWRPQKEMYIRTFSSSVFDEDKNSRVFVTEVLDMIPVVLKKQGSRVDAFIEKFNQHRSKWSYIDSDDHYETMSLSELDRVLQTFDINKKFITIVPDVGYTFSHRIKMPLITDESVLTIQSPKVSFVVQDINQTMLQIFQSVVCQVNWNLECSDNDPTCKSDFLTKIIMRMEETHRKNEGLYVRCGIPIEMIKELQSHCYYKSQINKNKVIKKYLAAEYKSTINLLQFVADCKELQLDTFDYPPREKTENRLEEVYIPAWKARLLIMLELIEKFFDGKPPHLKQSVLEGLNFKVPLLDWKKQSDLTDLLWNQNETKKTWAEALWFACDYKQDELENHEWMLKDVKEREKLVAHRKNTSDGKQYEEMEKRSMNILAKLRLIGVKNQSETDSEIRNSDKNDAENNKEQNDGSTETSRTESDVKDEVASEKKENVTINQDGSPMPSSCDKCVTNNEELDKANEKFMIEQNKIKPLEEKNSNIEKQLADVRKRVEKERKNQEEIKNGFANKDKTIRTLEKKSTSQQKDFAELEKLRGEIPKVQESLEQLKGQLDREQKASFEAETQLRRKKMQIERELQSQKRSMDKLDEDNEKLLEEVEPYGDQDLEVILNRQNRLKEEMAQELRETQNLRESNMRLQFQNEEKARTYDLLLDRIQNTKYDSPAPSQEPSTSSQNLSASNRNAHPLPAEIQKKLVEWQETKEMLLTADQVQQAESLAHQLIISTDEESIRADIRYELKNYKRKYKIFINTLEQNIQKIQNNKINALAQLPDLPTFSPTT